MTDATTLLALAIGCILGALVVAVIYETSHRRHQRRATGARTALGGEWAPVDTPRPERLPAGYVPLSRMTREEVQQHLQRLKPDWAPPTVRTVDLTAPKPEPLEGR